MTTNTRQRLTAVSAAIERHYGYPVDIEFAIKNGKLYILQVRPITTASSPSKSTSPVTALLLTIISPGLVTLLGNLSKTLQR